MFARNNFFNHFRRYEVGTCILAFIGGYGKLKHLKREEKKNELEVNSKVFLFQKSEYNFFPEDVTKRDNTQKAFDLSFRHTRIIQPPSACCSCGQRVPAMFRRTDTRRKVFFFFLYRFKNIKSVRASIGAEDARARRFQKTLNMASVSGKRGLQQYFEIDSLHPPCAKLNVITIFEILRVK